MLQSATIPGADEIVEAPQRARLGPEARSSRGDGAGRCGSRRLRQGCGPGGMSDYKAVLDACVLVKACLRDTLLRLAEEPRLYIPFWSAEILEVVG